MKKGEITEPRITKLLQDHEAVRQAMWQSIRKALIRHMKLGESVIVSEDGKMKELSPKEIGKRLGIE